MKPNSDQQKILLIVEDDEVLLRTLFLFFHKSGYAIASATDGETGLNMARRLKPDLVLLDLLLPKLDGFGVLKDLKADPALKKIPVIVLSNLGDESEISRAKSLGAEDYFVKAEVNLVTLRERVDKLMGLGS